MEKEAKETKKKKKREMELTIYMYYRVKVMLLRSYLRPTPYTSSVAPYSNLEMTSPDDTMLLNTGTN